VRVLQLLPRPPESDEALGAFALALASGLEVHGIHSDFVAACGHTAAGLEEQLRGPGAAPRAVLVHYVNYAYEPRGVPTALVATLESWRRAAHTRLVTLFHEVHASGPPWRSSFWLAPLQRRLAARLLHASDGAVTSQPAYRELLRRLGGDALVLPVFSTCGEPERVPAFESRRASVVVFGSAGNRARVYGSFRDGLAWAVRMLHAELVHDIGVPIPLPKSVDGVPVVGLGRLEADELSQRLLVARGGVLAHGPDFLHKSTTYAAYAAHGVVPVAVGTPQGLAPDAPPALTPGAATVSPRQAEAVAEAARAAYASHARAVHVAAYARLLADPTA